MRCVVFVVCWFSFVVCDAFVYVWLVYVCSNYYGMLVVCCLMVGVVVCCVLCGVSVSFLCCELFVP